MIRAVKVLKVIVILFVLTIVCVNILQPLFQREVKAETRQKIENTVYRSDTAGNERICCVDTNEDALTWRLRMIASAKESIILTTFDLRTDQSGTDVIAALCQAADRGVEVKVLLDGIYQPIYLRNNETFQAFCSHEKIEVRFYNPLKLKNIYHVNYRMHDKYLIIDEQMYLLGGRNTNDIFLGNYKENINIDREILVYETEPGQGESYKALVEYFNQVWNASCVEAAKADITEEKRQKMYEELEERYAGWLEKDPEIATYDRWLADTYPADKITLVTNGIQAENKQPEVLAAIEYLASQAENVLIQSPYVICNGAMYEVLQKINEGAQVSVILNAVEKGSNPWGCTDYLNNKKKILNTGTVVYELMNEVAVHTKTVVIDEDISIVGSYNLDMRSTYLDTELMLVIDSEMLNSHIREMAAEYQEKSVAVWSEDSQTKGPLYQAKELSTQKEIFYGVLRIIIRPFRHML